MSAALKAGMAYFVLVFGLAFLLGALRTLLLEQGIGSRGLLVGLEIPVVVTYAWWAAGWVCRRFVVPTATMPRVMVGLIMFVLLRLGEMMVGLMAMGQGINAQIQALATLQGILELLPQMLVAAFPFLRATLLAR